MSQFDTTVLTVQERLNNYITSMRPGAVISSDIGAAMQVSLWNTIRLAMRHDAQEFVTLWNMLLDAVRTHRNGVFNERYVYRFLDVMKVSAPDRRNFERIMNLLMTTCDPQTRFLALRQVSLDTTLAGITNDAERNRVIAFYNP